MADSKKPKATPPPKPKYRAVNDLSKSIKMAPYFLVGDPEVIREHIESHRENELYERDDIFAVAVGMLKFKHYLNYENVHAETLDQTANKVMYVFYAMSKRLNPDIDERPVPELIIDEVSRVTQTPFGPMYGSLEKNGTLLLIFLLTQFGRIVGVNGNGEYDLEDVSEDEIIELLDPGALFTIDDADGKSTFLDVLEITGLYDPTKAAKASIEDGTLQEEDLKN
jgi:hypothetical protein